jgi:hypothetical protein
LQAQATPVAYDEDVLFLCTQELLDNTDICVATVLQTNLNSKTMTQCSHASCKPRPMLLVTWETSHYMMNIEYAAQRTITC